MKRLTVIILSALMVFSLTACGSSSQNRAEETPAESQTETLDGEQEDGSTDSEEQNQESPEGSSSQAEAGDTAGTGGGNILVAYFSVMETDGVDTVTGASRVTVDGEVLGNNQYIAQIVQQQVGGDLFSIETVQEYPTTHEPLLDFAYEEKADNARPELATHIENPDSYDVIFLGFPNWNADLPMPLYTFLEEYDFSGKTIIPFCTSGSSGIGSSAENLHPLADGAAWLDGRRFSGGTGRDAMIEWANDMLAETQAVL